MRNVISIRGGGIRGIIPCCCLIQLEQQLGGLTREHIDYCAGTSTGALLTAAVAAGIPATQILTVYTERSKEIFTPAGLAAGGKRLIREFMYDPQNLYNALVSVLGPGAAWTINDSRIGIMLSATAMDGHNWFFVKDNGHNAGSTGGVKLVDAAVASACAPTYFDYWPVPGIKNQPQLNMFDGGAGGTANPAYQACVEIFQYDNFTPADTRVISLGTGFFPAPNDPPHGLVETIGWVTSTLVDSGEDWVDDAVNRQWPGVMQVKNPQLPSNIDEADISAIPTLVQIGRQMAAGMDWRQLLG